MGLNGWTLVSRTRYALVWSAVGVSSGLAIMALGSLSVLELLLAIPAFILAFLINGWVRYPRAKQRERARP